MLTEIIQPPKPPLPKLQLTMDDRETRLLRHLILSVPCTEIDPETRDMQNKIMRAIGDWEAVANRYR